MGRQPRSAPQRLLRCRNHLRRWQSRPHQLTKPNHLVNKRHHFPHQHHSSNHGHRKSYSARQYNRNCDMAVLLTPFQCFRADDEHEPQHSHRQEAGPVGVDERDGPSTGELHVGAGGLPHPTELHLEKRPPPLAERPVERPDFYRYTVFVFLVPQWIS